MSLTPAPANAHALVTRRYPLPPSLKFFDLTAQAVGKMMEMIEALRVLNRAQPEPQPAPKAVLGTLPNKPAKSKSSLSGNFSTTPAPAPARRRAASSFSSMVEALNSREAHP